MVGFDDYLDEAKIGEVPWIVEAEVIFGDIGYGIDGVGKKMAEEWWESGGVGARKGKREGTVDIKESEGGKRERRRKLGDHGLLLFGLSGRSTLKGWV